MKNNGREKREIMGGETRRIIRGDIRGIMGEKQEE
jgi:hypothetical protein